MVKCTAEYKFLIIVSLNRNLWTTRICIITILSNRQVCDGNQNLASVCFLFAPRHACAETSINARKFLVADIGQPEEAWCRATCRATAKSVALNRTPEWILMTIFTTAREPGWAWLHAGCYFFLLRACAVRQFYGVTNPNCGVGLLNLRILLVHWNGCRATVMFLAFVCWWIALLFQTKKKLSKLDMRFLKYR